MEEPQDQALGRSPGGFGTQVPRVCASGGILLAVVVTPGPRHESQALAEVLSRARRPRRAGRPRWPAQAAGDKGYSYPGIHAWLRRRHSEPVIPPRKEQPRAEGFDKSSYRKRHMVERVVGWFKECRALGTRYDKLAGNDVALWIIANIHYLLRKYTKTLETGLSETA
jgi:transposase